MSQEDSAQLIDQRSQYPVLETPVHADVVALPDGLRLEPRPEASDDEIGEPHVPAEVAELGGKGGASTRLAVAAAGFAQPGDLPATVGKILGPGGEQPNL